MSRIDCQRCNGSGLICARCGLGRSRLSTALTCCRNRGISRGCRSKETEPCPGVSAGEPHFLSRIRCDGACSSREKPEPEVRFYDFTSATQERWYHGSDVGIDDFRTHFCGDCRERFNIARDLSMTGDPFEAQTSIACGFAFALGLTGIDGWVIAKLPPEVVA